MAKKMMDLEPYIDQEYDVEVTAVHDEEQLALALNDMYEEMKTLREPHDWIWRELWEYCLPEREALINWFEQTSYGTDGAKGWVKRIGQRIYDMTAPNALHLLTAGLQGYMVSQQDRWFRLTYPHPEMIDKPGGRRWLQEVERVIYLALARSNFYSQLSPLILDAATNGTASQRMYYDASRQRHVFTTMHPIEVFVAQNHFMEIDTVLRVFKLTRRQAIQHFGKENLSKELVETDSDTDHFLFLHAVFPRGDTDAAMGLRPRSLASVLSIDAPYCSVYKELATGTMNAGNRMMRGGGGGVVGGRNDTGKIISVGGFHEFPFTAWRWDVDTQSTYGTSPCRRLLPGIRQINEFALNLTRAARLASDPPYNVPANMQDRVRITPRGFNYYQDPNYKIEPILAAGGTYPVGRDREEHMSNALNEAFGIPYFLALSRLSAQGESKTATEVIGVESEKAAVLASSMGRMGTDCLAPSLDWVFQQEWRAGNIPPPPQWMQRRDGKWERVGVDYISPLAMAQKRLATIQRPLKLLEVLAPVAAIRPEVMDNIDLDVLVRKMIEDGGMPYEAIRSHADVQKLRELAQQREEARQAIENVEGVSRAARNMGVAADGAGAGAGGANGAAVSTVLPQPVQR